METLFMEERLNGYYGFVTVDCDQLDSMLSKDTYVNVQAPHQSPFWGKIVRVDGSKHQYHVQLMGIEQVPFNTTID